MAIHWVLPTSSPGTESFGLLWVFSFWRMASAFVWPLPMFMWRVCRQSESWRLWSSTEKKAERWRSTNTPVRTLAKRYTHVWCFQLQLLPCEDWAGLTSPAVSNGLLKHHFVLHEYLCFLVMSSFKTANIIFQLPPPKPNPILVAFGNVTVSGTSTDYQQGEDLKYIVIQIIIICSL